MKAELIVDAPIDNQKKVWVKIIQKPHFDHPLHYHKLCELTWIEKGYGKLIIGDYVGDFMEGELIFEGPGLPHLWKSDNIFYSKNDFITKAIAIYFSPEFLLSIIEGADSREKWNDILIKSERGLRLFGNTKVLLISLITKIVSSKGLERIGLFLQALGVILRTNEYDMLASANYQNTFNEQDMDRFNLVYQFLLNNFERDIKIEEVASLCNMTATSFCRFFKSKTQKTFIQFLNEIRIGHACKLLQNENKSVSDVCYESGFNSPVNFFNFFKLITNRTPAEYRKIIRKLE
jgi:AraC-like DNA-binding protein